MRPGLPAFMSKERTMNSKINPTDIMPPFNNAYAHGVVISPNSKILHTAGQVGAKPDGSVSSKADEQAAQLWRNLLAILRDANMAVTDIVKLTAYIVGEDTYPAYAAVRSKVLGDHKPASTAICIPRLLRSEWLIEVELIAAR
jgi:2-iminobutanoate/2-iminopropanoate deaminase